MGWVVGAIIVYIIIASMVVYWKITLSIFLLGIIIYFIIIQEKKEKKKREEQEETRQSLLRQQKYEEERIRQKQLAGETERRGRQQKINALIVASKSLSQDMAERIRSTQQALNEAEQEYKEHAYNPFWDAIEVATTQLAYFNEGINRITGNCRTYQTESRQLGSPPPPFDWQKAAEVPDAAATVERLQKIVRKAQKDPVFAVVYNQIKTNRILVSGFSGLGQALNEITHRIGESTAVLSAAVADLSFTVADTSEKAIEAGREDTRAVIESMRVIRKQTKAEAEVEAEARREHEQRELEMLDNIQHRRKPSFPEYRGGPR